jgi:hypothetical protein
MSDAATIIFILAAVASVATTLRFVRHVLWGLAAATLLNLLFLVVFIEFECAMDEHKPMFGTVVLCAGAVLSPISGVIAAICNSIRRNHSKEAHERTKNSQES